MIISNDVDDFVTQIENGNVVCFKTDTIWGFSANSKNIKAIQKLYEIKHRNLDKPFIFLIKKGQDLTELVKTIPPQAQMLIDKFWCGPLTIIFEAKENLDILKPYKNNKTIALRMPQDELTQQILNKLDSPLPSTSVNIEGQKSLNSFYEIKEMFSEQNFCILENTSNNQTKNISSTIVSFASGNLEILREGTITKEQILKAININ